MKRHAMSSNMLTLSVDAAPRFLTGFLLLLLLSTSASAQAPCVTATFEDYARLTDGCALGTIRVAVSAFTAGTVGGPLPSMSDILVIPSLESGNAILRLELSPTVGEVGPFRGYQMIVGFAATVLPGGGPIKGTRLQLGGTAISGEGFVRAIDLRCPGTLITGVASSLPYCFDPATDESSPPMQAVLFHDSTGEQLSSEVMFPPTLSIDLATNFLMNSPAGVTNGDVSMSSFTYIYYQDQARTPLSKEDCRNEGWRTLARQDGTLFKNHGDCVSYVTTGR